MEKLKTYEEMVTQANAAPPKTLKELDLQRGVIPKGGMKNKDFMEEALPKAQKAYLDAMAEDVDVKVRRDTADRVFEMKGWKGKKDGGGSQQMFVFGDKALENLKAAFEAFGAPAEKEAEGVDVEILEDQK